MIVYLDASVLVKRYVAEAGSLVAATGIPLWCATRLPRSGAQDLRELQDNRRFYCERRIDGQVEVDHFIPWARHPDNGIENLVVADQRCNGKSVTSSLPSSTWSAGRSDSQLLAVPRGNNSLR